MIHFHPITMYNTVRQSDGAKGKIFHFGCGLVSWYMAPFAPTKTVFFFVSQCSKWKRLWMCLCIYRHFFLYNPIFLMFNYASLAIIYCTILILYGFSFFLFLLLTFSFSLFLSLFIIHSLCNILGWHLAVRISKNI